MECKHLQTHFVEIMGSTPHNLKIYKVCNSCDWVIKSYHNLQEIIQALGWQGGTIWQVRRNIISPY